MIQRELLDRRVLGAVRFVSQITRLPVEGAIHVTAAPATAPGQPSVPLPVDVRPNRQGLQVLYGAPGFGDYAETFSEEDLTEVTPPALELRLRATAADDRFLPRDFLFTVPRTLNTLSTPLEVALYPTPTASLADGWSVLNVRVERELANPPTNPLKRVPIPGALVRVLQPPVAPATVPTVVLGSGVTEWRQYAQAARPSVGEGLVALAGIRLFRWSTAPGGNVLDGNQEVNFEIRFDTGFDPKPTGIAVRDPRNDPAPNFALLENFTGTDPTSPIRSRIATTGGAFQLRARERRNLLFVFNPTLTALRLI
jgi:hypothetical protein